MSLQDILKQLRDTSGPWHQLAGFLPHLARAGYDTGAIEKETGIERIQQNVWAVAGQVWGAELLGIRPCSSRLHLFCTVQEGFRHACHLNSLC